MDPQDGPDNAERERLARLALADWSPAAGARVDSVLVSARRAAVNLFVNGDYEYSEYFRRGEDGQWDEAGSSNGHSTWYDLDAVDRDT